MLIRLVHLNTYTFLTDKKKTGINFHSNRYLWLFKYSQNVFVEYHLYYNLNEIPCLTHHEAVREPTDRWWGGIADNFDNSLYFIQLPWHHRLFIRPILSGYFSLVSIKSNFFTPRWRNYYKENLGYFNLYLIKFSNLSTWMIECLNSRELAGLFHV